MLSRPLGGLLLWAALVPSSHAEGGAEALVEELIVAAREDALSLAWVEDHVQPAPSGWTDTARALWQRALVSGGPLQRTLARSAGVGHVARGTGPTRVVLDGLPLLSVLVDERGEPRIVEIAATTCFSCDERARFAKDLIADVRRRGRLAARLAPGLELDLTRWVQENPGVTDDRWASTLATYLRTDATVADRIGGAAVVGSDGDAVLVRYPDGTEDRWPLAWHDPMGWRLDYAGLSATSPLRIEAQPVRDWRRPESARAARFATWRPTNETLPDGAGRRIGEHAVGAAIDGRDDTIVLSVQALDRSVSAVFRVDATDGEVVERVALPLEGDRRTARATDAWSTRWPLALDPTSPRAAAATPVGVVIVDFGDDSSTVAIPLRSPVAALAWSPEGALGIAYRRGDVSLGDTTLRAPVEGEPIALHVGTQGASWVTDTGAVVVVEGDAPPRVRTVCDGHAAGAALRERDGRWLVACGPEASASHTLVPWYDGASEVFGSMGQAAPAAVGWSNDGERYAIARPEGGVVVWNGLLDVQEAAFGRRPLMEVAFSNDGAHLVGITPSGDVLWWDLPTARRLHGHVEVASDEGSGP